MKYLENEFNNDSYVIKGWPNHISGPFSVFKNIETINKLYKKTNYKDILNTAAYLCFDEGWWKYNINDSKGNYIGNNYKDVDIEFHYLSMSLLVKKYIPTDKVKTIYFHSSHVAWINWKKMSDLNRYNALYLNNTLYRQCIKTSKIEEVGLYHMFFSKNTINFDVKRNSFLSY